MTTFQVELVWNRETRWVRYGQPYFDIKDAIKWANDIENSGDGARVKKTRIVDKQGEVCWANGQLIKNKATAQESHIRQVLKHGDDDEGC